ncbi:MAG: Uncharacterized protein FD147_323 [Chloroflexi bacterium]|nr:MAG: Uncharacterized protein FD147_323 [Chloroflexota bacterium]
MKKRIVFFVLVFIIAIMALSACSVVNDISTVSDNGKAFMTALRDGDHTTSWNLLTPEVQTEIGSQEAWVDFATPRNFSDWKFTNTSVENNTAQMDGETTLGAETYTVLLVFAKLNDAWKISGINFTFLK